MNSQDKESDNESDDKHSTQSQILNQVRALPDQPGVYLFRNAKGDIIYIGKAVSLKSRVRSYWNQASWRERPKLAVMVPKVATLDTILTNSEKEALLLEATLIQKHMPRYNIALKDDKRYPWLAITYDVAYPRLVMIRDPVRFRHTNPKAKIFGPYVQASAMWETVRILRKVFPMRQRKSPLFKDRPCMNYHIGLCLAPCQKMVEESDYDKMVYQVEMFLAGRQKEVVDQLKSDMESASESLDFETAAKLRDRLKALSTVIERQQVFFESEKISYDVFGEAHTYTNLSVCLMRVREGKLISSECVNIPLTDQTGWDEAYESFIDQYYASCEDISIPREVILKHKLPDEHMLLELLQSKSAHGRAVSILVPQRGDKVKLIEMSSRNAKMTLENEISSISRDNPSKAEMEPVLLQLKEELGLKNIPEHIECFDISNIQGTDNVASMVVFQYGKPAKGMYRTFKIKSVEGEPNDFASMKEVVKRRYTRLVKDQKPLPDLIIIDGGKGQLSAALEALSELEQEEPVFKLSERDIIGLAKKREEIYLPHKSDPILLSRRNEGLFVLQKARNEAHRFALTFHRKLRAKRSISSNIDKLNGVGKVRRKLLLDHFGSFDKLKEASLEELMQVPGLGKGQAQAIFTSLNNQAQN
ncbi:MAG: excinuclease ABC subunit UvrC [Candidatus Melainabacteria bacterium]|nr:excinuclease ABC subunit UvrC [Candidatus Melainabacteria bacterium]